MPFGDDGEGMQVTAAQYFTPNGRSVHKVGITPDIEAKLPEGDVTLYEMGDLADAQLKVAYDVAMQKLNGHLRGPHRYARRPRRGGRAEGEAASIEADPSAQNFVTQVS